MAGSIRHLLNRSLAVWRPVTADDGAGGQTVVWVHTANVAAKIDQPSADEREVAQQWAAEHTHTIRFVADADVARGDELRGDDQVFRVLAVLQPSRPVYLRALAQLTQSEPGSVES